MRDMRGKVDGIDEKMGAHFEWSRGKRKRIDE